MNPEIIKEKISKKELEKHLDVFGEMIKVVVDIEREIMTIGGSLHADGEKFLLENGSKQDNIWGANLYPDAKDKDKIIYESLINIRPNQNNRAMEVQDVIIRRKIEKIINKLLF